MSSSLYSDATYPDRRQWYFAYKTRTLFAEFEHSIGNCKLTLLPGPVHVSVDPGRASYQIFSTLACSTPPRGACSGHSSLARPWSRCWSTMTMMLFPSLRPSLLLFDHPNPDFKSTAGLPGTSKSNSGCRHCGVSWVAFSEFVMAVDYREYASHQGMDHLRQHSRLCHDSNGDHLQQSVNLNGPSPNQLLNLTHCSHQQKVILTTSFQASFLHHGLCKCPSSPEHASRRAETYFSGFTFPVITSAILTADGR